MDSTELMVAGRAGTAARREAILDAGKAVFLEEGFAVASMDRIAERAGVTKRTVYAHFPSKQALFGAAVERACANVVSQIPQADAVDPDPRVGLMAALERTRELMISENCVRLQRIVAAEAERHPEFARTLRDAFAAGEALQAAALARWVAAGRLRPHDTVLAARMLNDLTGYATALRGMLGETHAEPATVAEAVRLYLAAYGTDA